VVIELRHGGELVLALLAPVGVVSHVCRRVGLAAEAAVACGGGAVS